VFGTVAFEILEGPVARTFSFLYGPLRIAKKLLSRFAIMIWTAS
jgi:hypothetical protein